MKTVDALEAESQFSTLLDRAEHGEEIVVARRGEPVVRISPFKVAPGSAVAQHAMDELRDRANQIGLSVTIEDIQAWINAGRA